MPDKNPLLDLVPEAIDNAAKNLTDKPTKSIGDTLSDIWYLVFGGISQAANKRKLKYSYALQAFEEELKTKISKIPDENLIEPDIQIVAPALEASKYCIEKEELRYMFSNLISNSLNIEFSNEIRPIYIDIVKSLTPLDAKLLLNFYNNSFDNEIDFSNPNAIIPSLESLAQLGLITYKHNYSYGYGKCDYVTDKDNQERGVFIETYDLKKVLDSINSDEKEPIRHKKILIGDETHLTKLGFNFVRTCFSDN